MVQPLFEFPNASTLRACIGQDGLTQLIEHANEIVNKRVRLFGGDAVPLDISQPDNLPHWTTYEISNVHPADIKLIWEPARFGWVFTLGRAYYLSRDERYPQVFWLFLEEFWEDNPINRGPNWISAQEVAFRLMALVFAGQVFARSIYTTPEKMARLSASVAAHAERIPPTMIYARAQNNNHLLSEAAGLLTAASALPTHPSASRWARLGWKWFNRGIETQIAADGAYVQHSTNYHRLMLQLALWVNHIHKATNGKLSQAAIGNLQRATQWLLALLDSTSGRVPNLGPNDGAYIFPFTNCPFDDYRPVGQAASQIFLGQQAIEPGPWDEMTLWLGGGSNGIDNNINSAGRTSHIIRHPVLNSWAYLRSEKYTSRPGHADQLHLDLWWQGLNVAMDAGTYLYNAHAPWDNRLSSALVHNTVTVNGQDQMNRVGKFLYLDWAQAEIRPVASDDATGLVARHNGYRRLGISHQRTVRAEAGDRWLVEDLMLPDEKVKSENPQPVTCTLHWLLPDWPYELQIAYNRIRIQSSYGWISIQVGAEHEDARPMRNHLQLIRAGQVIYGTGNFSPILGWYSPMYGYKSPALSFRYELTTTLPLRFVTDWRFPDKQENLA